MLKGSIRFEIENKVINTANCLTLRSLTRKKTRYLTELVFLNLNKKSSLKQKQRSPSAFGGSPHESHRKTFTGNSLVLTPPPHFEHMWQLNQNFQPDKSALQLSSVVVNTTPGVNPTVAADHRAGYSRATQDSLVPSVLILLLIDKLEFALCYILFKRYTYSLFI